MKPGDRVWWYSDKVVFIGKTECPHCGSDLTETAQRLRVVDRAKQYTGEIISITQPSSKNQFKGGPIVTLAVDGWDTNKKTKHMSYTCRLRRVHLEREK